MDMVSMKMAKVSEPAAGKQSIYKVKSSQTVPAGEADPRTHPAGNCEGSRTDSRRDIFGHESRHYGGI